MDATVTMPPNVCLQLAPQISASQIVPPQVSIPTLNIAPAPPLLIVSLPTAPSLEFA